MLDLMRMAEDDPNLLCQIWYDMAMYAEKPKDGKKSWVKPGETVKSAARRIREERRALKESLNR